MFVWRRAATVFLLLSSCAFCFGFAPDDPFAQMRLLIDGGYYASASQVVGPSLVRANPESAEAHYLYSLSLYLTGDLENARAQLDLARELDGSRANPDFDWLLGLLQAADSHYESALRLLRNAFLRSGDYRMAMDWGRVAWQSGNYQEALRAYRAAGDTEVGQRELWPFLDMGRIYVYLGEYEKAIEAFDTVTQMFEAAKSGAADLPSPAYVEAFFRLGEVYEAQGDLAEAELNYENALAADPNYLPAVRALDRLKRLP